MSSWTKVKVVPWMSHKLPAFEGLEWIEINFDFVESKRAHSYVDNRDVARNGTLITTASGKSYILASAPDQYPGAR